MEIIGFDLHKRESQLAIRQDDGSVLDRRIATRRDRLQAVFGGRPRAKVLLEASTESEWVATYLETLGHEVIVADPNFAPMYATRTRRIKTDKRDARALQDACALGAYRPAHRLSPERRHIRAELAVRDALVRTRVRYIALGKTLARRDGLRVPSSTSRRAATRLAQLEASPLLAAELAPLLAVLTPLTAEIAAADARLATLAAGDPIMQLLATAPQVGIVTAAAFVATLDDVTRFPSSHAVEAYLGLVPSEDSSGDGHRLGRITRSGNARMRWLLVEAAWGLLRSRHPDAAHLRAWGRRVAARRGTRIAAVALARRLAGILFAMWRDHQPYSPPRRATPAH